MNDVQQERFTVLKGYPHFLGDNWCAKCRSCGAWLTKFAFTAEEAAEEAREALESQGRGALGNHVCR